MRGIGVRTRGVFRSLYYGLVCVCCYLIELRQWTTLIFVYIRYNVFRRFADTAFGHFTVQVPGLQHKRRYVRIGRVAHVFQQSIEPDIHVGTQRAQRLFHVENGRDVRAVLVGQVPGDRENLYGRADGRERPASPVGDLRDAVAKVYGIRCIRLAGVKRRE